MDDDKEWGKRRRKDNLLYDPFQLNFQTASLWVENRLFLDVVLSCTGWRWV